MHCKRRNAREAQRDCEPIQNAGIGSDAEICPERKKEGIVRVERNPAHNVTQCGAEKKRKQRAGTRKDHVPERRPYGTCDVIAKFHSDSTQDEQPEPHHHRPIKPAESRCICGGKCEKERAAASTHPQLVALPYLPDPL